MPNHKIWCIPQIPGCNLLSGQQMDAHVFGTKLQWRYPSGLQWVFKVRGWTPMRTTIWRWFVDLFSSFFPSKKLQSFKDKSFHLDSWIPPISVKSQGFFFQFFFVPKSISSVNQRLRSVGGWQNQPETGLDRPESLTTGEDSTERLISGTNAGTDSQADCLGFSNGCKALLTVNSNLNTDIKLSETQTSTQILNSVKLKTNSNRISKDYGESAKQETRTVQRQFGCHFPWSKFGEHGPVENGEHVDPPGNHGTCTRWPLAPAVTNHQKQSHTCVPIFKNKWGKDSRKHLWKMPVQWLPFQGHVEWSHKAWFCVTSEPIVFFPLTHLEWYSRPVSAWSMLVHLASWPSVLTWNTRVFLTAWHFSGVLSVSLKRTSWIGLKCCTFTAVIWDGFPVGEVDCTECSR